MFLVKTTGVYDADNAQLSIDHTPAEMIAAYSNGQTVLFELTADVQSEMYEGTVTEAAIFMPEAYDTNGEFFKFSYMVKEASGVIYMRMTCELLSDGTAVATMSFGT